MWWGMVGIGFWRGSGAGVFRSDLRVWRAYSREWWLVVSGRVFGAGVSWYGGSLVVARGWWSVWARALAGCFLVVVVGWLVGVAF